MSSASLFDLEVEQLADGRFDDTACVLLNTKGDMIGTRVSGPVSSELRDIPGGAGGPAGRWSKILSLAPKVGPLIIATKGVQADETDHLG